MNYIYIVVVVVVLLLNAYVKDGLKSEMLS